jgi:carbamoyltransferase
MHILGINSAYHEPSACITRDGAIVAAVEEERFNRVRHGKPSLINNPHHLPVESIRYCLAAASISPAQLDHIGFSFNPPKRLAKNVRIREKVNPGDWGSKEGEQLFHDLLMSNPERLSHLLNEDITGKFKWIDHHLCHAASTFFVSPFDNAAILTTDGIGEFTSTWMGHGHGNRLTRLWERGYPHSVGFLWTKMSRFLGFGEYGQWKVMGLGGYGDPNRFMKPMHKVVHYAPDGNYWVNKRYMQFRLDSHSEFEKLFGPCRGADAPIEDWHADLAATLQSMTNSIVLGLERRLHRLTGAQNLCRAGGVALNCVTNAFLEEHGPFKRTFVMPAPNDGGTSVGACYYIWNHLLGKPRGYVLDSALLGPSCDDKAVELILKKQQAVFNRIEHPEQLAARLVADGNVVAWYQGRMEFGPRALGDRSILADPRRADMPFVLNTKVKHREHFRPFAASVLEEAAGHWFDIPRPSLSNRFMLYAYPVKAEKMGLIPAVTHIDGTCRIQCVSLDENPSYYGLIEEFGRLTGIPMVLNTSFNETEPIICSPEEALNTCRRGGIDHLVIGHFWVRFKGAHKRAAQVYNSGGSKRPLRDLVVGAVQSQTAPKHHHLLDGIDYESRRQLTRARRELPVDPDKVTLERFLLSRR